MSARVNITKVPNIPKQDITILSDSQSAIRILNTNGINSTTVYKCSKCMNEVAERYTSIMCGYRDTMTFQDIAE